MVRKAIEFFAKKLNDEQKVIITDCLKMIEFGMGNTLITFKDKYYEYGGSTNIEERGLTIGGYESAWLADLVASFLLENSQDLFEQTSKYHGIYRDDGIIFFKGKWINEDIMRWIQTFQLRVDDLCDSNGLQFTAEICQPDMNTRNVCTKINDKITEETKT